MTGSLVRLFCLIGLAVALGGCAMGRQVSSFSIDYNRAIADSRNEMLLLNIVRASHREPFQFSTIASVQAALEMAGSVDVGADKLVEWRANGRDKDIASLSPKVNLSTSSKPTFTVQPLNDKDFTSQMLMPITPETVQLLLDQSWDPEFIFPLVISGIRCGKEFLPNSYHPKPTDVAQQLSSNQWRAKLEKRDAVPSVGEKQPGAEAQTFDVPAEKAPEMLHNGVGEGYKIAITSTNAKRGTVRVKIWKTADSVWVIEGLPPICPGSAGLSQKAFWTKSEGEKTLLAPGEAEVKFRSIEAILYYLGEAVRNNATIRYQSECKPAEVSSGYRCPIRKELFDLKRGQPTGPVAVETDFRGQHFWIPVYPLPTASTPSAASDRTLSTLSVLSQLIALQTRDDSKSVPQPVINVGSR